MSKPSTNSVVCVCSPSQLYFQNEDAKTMTESLIHDRALLVEYYTAMCAEWGCETDDQGHFRVETTISGSDEQVLIDSIAEVSPDKCPACSGEVVEDYSLVSWAAGERVHAKEAFKMLRETNGYRVLRFSRDGQPTSNFSDEYFEDDDDLVVAWDGSNLRVQRQFGSEDVLFSDRDRQVEILKELTCSYPVSVAQLTESVFKEMPRTTF